jgi:FkbM family methyltransferase
MTDYLKQINRSPLKRLVLTLAMSRLLNPLGVALVRAFAPVEIQRRFPVLNAKAVMRPRAWRTPVTLLNVDRCQVAKDVYWGRGSLASPADILALSLATKLSDDADVFLDIGAYTGLFALTVAKHNPKIESYAYEILPENFQLLWQNVFENDLVSRVHPVLCGIGKAEGSLSAPTTFGPGVLPSGIALDSEAAAGVKIPILPLDEIFADFNGAMVWKIDVERFELDVFLGAKGLISRCKVDIICEVLNDSVTVGELDSLLIEGGFSKFLITDAGLNKMENITPSAKYRDWLFTRRASSDLISMGFRIHTD